MSQKCSEKRILTYQVVSQELHDEGGVLVAFLAKGVEFCGNLLKLFFLGFRVIKLTGNSIIESLLGKVAGLIRGVQNLIVENGEVESKTKADWVCWCKVSLGNFGSVLVCLEGLVRRLLSLVANGKFGKVSVVVTFPVIDRLDLHTSQDRSKQRLNQHLVVENLRFSALGRRNQVLVKNLKDVFTDLGKFGLNLLTVLLDQGNLR